MIFVRGSKFSVNTEAIARQVAKNQRLITGQNGVQAAHFRNGPLTVSVPVQVPRPSNLYDLTQSTRYPLALIPQHPVATAVAHGQWLAPHAQLVLSGMKSNTPQFTAVRAIGVKFDNERVGIKLGFFPQLPHEHVGVTLIPKSMTQSELLQSIAKAITTTRETVPDFGLRPISFEFEKKGAFYLKLDDERHGLPQLFKGASGTLAVSSPNSLFLGHLIAGLETPAQAAWQSIK